MQSNILNRRIKLYKTLVCFDFDGTLTASNALHQLYIFKVNYYGLIVGFFWRLLFLIQIPYFYYLYKTDNKLFNRFLYGRYRGMQQKKLLEILDKNVALFLWRQLFPQAEKIMQQLKKEQTDIVIISASWSPVVEYMALLLGIKFTFATQLEVKQGLLTGKIIDFVDGERKAQKLNQFLMCSAQSYGKVVAYGNSTWDIPMLNCADEAYVINPNKKLKDWAITNKIETLSWSIKKRHWSIGFFLPITKFYLGSFKGWQHIPKTGGCIVIANHTSYLDHYMLYPLIGLVTGRRAKFISKVEHFKSPIFAKIITYLGAYPIDRHSSAKAALDVCIELVKNGELLIIYPEGTRGDNRIMNEFKAGVVLIQEKTQAPVLPVGIVGAFDAWSPAKKYPTTGTIDVTIGALIPSVNSKQKTVKSEKINKKQRAAQLKQKVKELC
ncbi:MAG: HAD-IB family hydrolase [Saccharospirillaceae bacterium]|nr:HAD-IB family hydrolase [Pseudomonadales bacterium]NRB78157.1 HAD-IB family hydrolase [Saccharospirillaceae bacterium]